MQTQLHPLQADGDLIAAYALQSHREQEFIIIGVLIQKVSFFRRFLPAMAADSKLFHFFLQPDIQDYADEFLHLRFQQDTAVRRLLELMVMEYAFPQEDTQKILEPLVLSLLMYIAREYSHSCPASTERLSDRIVQYMSEHSDVVTLKKVAEHFSYHPNYISSLLHKELGRTFSELLLEQRMQKAAVMLKGTDLSVAEIAEILGYSNTSNFHIAFRDHYGKTPRAYAKTEYPD